MTAYYNEVDPFAAAWLRNLIAAGLIAPGVVDERSIVDVRADDLVGFSQCHFFAGIGGWSRALRLAGWADDRPVWTGSCPCQPFSVAGKGKGADDERHLWPVWFDLIRECRPAAVFGEQVAAAVGHNWLDAVSRDLEGEGYAIGSAVLGAHSVGAPHIRQRLWFVADADPFGRQGISGRGSAQGDGTAECGDPHVLADAERARVRDRGRGRDDGATGGMQGEAREQRLRDDAGAGSVGAGLLAHAVPAGRAEWRAEPGDGSPAVVRGSGGMGDTGGAGSSVRECEAVLGAGRRDEGGAVEQPGGSPGGVALSDSRERDGLAEHDRDVSDRATGGWLEGDSLPAGRSEDGGVENADVWIAQQPSGQRPGPRETAPAGACHQLDGRGELAARQPFAGPLHGFWRDADWLFCRDGKWRPVEPGTFPLAHGIPGRVGRLRAYGNAIVPQVAAEFIGAYLDAGAEDVYGVQLSTGGDDK